MEVAKQIFVGAVIALITTLINLAVSKPINYSLVAGAFLAAFLLFLIYRRYSSKLPFKKWRVTKDGKELRGNETFNDKEGNNHSLYTNDMGGVCWRFKARDGAGWVVYGPYITPPLRKGKYRAKFRIKVDGVNGENRPIIDIDVASASKDLGDKRLTGRTLTTHDFKRADEYRVFTLNFDVLPDEGENKLEMRLFSRGSEHFVDLDYVELSRRLF